MRAALAQQVYLHAMYFLGKQVKGYNWWAGDDKYSISHSSAPEDGLEDEDEGEKKGYAKLW